MKVDVSEAEEVILDDRRETPRVTDVRREPDTPIPGAPLLPRRSGELLAALRTPSEAPPDPVQARLDAWGEAIIARVDEASRTASRADSVAKRASKDNLGQDAAIGLLQADVAALKKTSSATLKKLTGLASPQVVTAIGTIVSVIAAALAAWAKSKGWLE